MLGVALGGFALVNFEFDLPSSIRFGLIFYRIQQFIHDGTSNIFLVNLSVESKA